MTPLEQRQAMALNKTLGFLLALRGWSDDDCERDSAAELYDEIIEAMAAPPTESPRPRERDAREQGQVAW